MGIQFKESTKRGAFFAHIAAVWVALLIAITALVAVLLQPGPQLFDMQKEFNAYSRATWFGRNYLLVWLGGSEADSKKLAEMSVGGTPKLNADPVTVIDINTLDATPIPAGKETEWQIKSAATIITPGDNGSTYRGYYELNVLQAGDTMKGLILGRPDNHKEVPIEVKPHYVVGIGVGNPGPLAKNVQQFMSAYYSADNGGSLGRFVTGSFTDSAIAGTPYKSIEVTELKASKDSADPSRAKPGDVVHVLVSATAFMSATTFHLLNVPLKMKFSPNKQWLVDGFDDPVDFGDVSYK